MACIGFERVRAGPGVQTVAALTVPGNCTHVEVQADTADIRYTLDGATDPSHAVGFIFEAGAVVTTPILREDLANIRFIEAGANAWLSVHYYAGRDV